MKATLYTHNEWFKLQMCKDRFESHLKIDSLKEVNTPLLTAAAMLNSNADSSTLGSSQVTVSSSTKLSEDGSSPTQVSSRDVVCDENAILKVMVSCGNVLLITTMYSLIIISSASSFNNLEISCSCPFHSRTYSARASGYGVFFFGQKGIIFS